VGINRRRMLWLTALCAAAVMMSACQAPTDDSSQPELSTEQTPEVDTAESGSEDAPIAQFLPDSPAATNAPYFRQVLADLGVGSERINADVVREALVDAGFNQDTIESTPDDSLIALPADSVSVAVVINDECLIGQYTSSWLAVDVAPVLSGGTCLVLNEESLD